MVKQQANWSPYDNNGGYSLYSYALRVLEAHFDSLIVFFYLFIDFNFLFFQIVCRNRWSRLLRYCCRYQNVYWLQYPYSRLFQNLPIVCFLIHALRFNCSLFISRSFFSSFFDVVGNLNLFIYFLLSWFSVFYLKIWKILSDCLRIVALWFRFAISIPISYLLEKCNLAIVWMCQWF